MPNANKTAGNNFEREVCKILEGVFKLSFQRVPNSGAFCGRSNAKRMTKMSDSQKLINRGDIIPPDELHNLAIECKKRKAFRFNMLFSKSVELDDWIDQSSHMEKDCLVLTIFKSNLKGIFVCHTIKENLENSNFMRYIHKDKVYYIETFTDAWIIKNKSHIEALCKK
jgi:hypothetical protein